ncbi:aspartic proteinase 39-like isoform X3 [Hibiscus syriacus]|uniref:aspartic proteinase 39-like isoform X3 n=1 Tax=Hibiscus syriacus TaxID=106335 RepID=UPI0019234F29|nr:aspartic proteinase 39-like isoform X3 [Hibiscus syriacus]
MMDLRRLALVVVTVAAMAVGELSSGCLGNELTLNVKRKFAGRGEDLSAMRAHDIRRHGRLLSTIAVDLPLGGNGHPSETGLYFAKIGLGNPSEDYYVQVDTGSDILWVNCAGCEKCPTKSDLGLDLKLYDPKRSSTSRLVYCDQDFCTSTYDGPLPGCKPNLQCQYNVIYGDGSSTAGYFVKDNIQLEQVTGNLQSKYANGTVVFGAHYNVVMKEIEVGDTLLRLPSDVFDTGDQKGTIVDSGTTLAYLPSAIYEPLMAEILSLQPALQLHSVEEQFTCFQYMENVDDGFPTVKFHFEGSLTLTIYPHEYLFQIREDIWCFGWQNSGTQSKDGKDMILLGDLVLSNRLVVYDVENQTIGWTEYNCSSSIKVRDESSGVEYTVGAHDIASGSSLRMGGILTLLSIIIALLHSSIA